MSGGRVVTAATVQELEGDGLLLAGAGCIVSDLALFRPVDDLGEARPIVLGEGCVVEAFAVVHGGAELGAGVRVESRGQSLPTVVNPLLGLTKGEVCELAINANLAPSDLADTVSANQSDL